MRVTDEQRLMLIAAALNGLCANPSVTRELGYMAYTPGAIRIAKMAIEHANEVVLKLQNEGGENENAA